MLSEDLLRDGLVDRWGLPEATVEPHPHPGMNSATWIVTAGGSRWVAKAVTPSAAGSFAGGLAVADRLEAAGVPAGAPLPTRDGEAVADLDGVPVALLRWVPGEPLRGTGAAEQRLLGATLARVHELLHGGSVEAAEQFHWVDPAAAHLAVRPWVRQRVSDAVAALDALDPRSLSQGLLHTDPAPEAFLVDRVTGSCGLIDWSTAMVGPLLYDLASAAMYVGGPDRAAPLIAAYLERAVMPRAEVERGLLVLLRFRHAVQADYFARRILTDDLTGIDSAAENEEGLAHARRWLARLSEPAGRAR